MVLMSVDGDDGEVSRLVMTVAGRTLLFWRVRVQTSPKSSTCTAFEETCEELQRSGWPWSAWRWARPQAVCDYTGYYVGGGASPRSPSMPCRRDLGLGLSGQVVCSSRTTGLVLQTALARGRGPVSARWSARAGSHGRSVSRTVGMRRPRTVPCCLVDTAPRSRSARAPIVPRLHPRCRPIIRPA
jgi:hypothetical protein